MSFGLSPSDIVSSLRIAHWIYTHGFSQEKRSDVQFRNFQAEVKSLHDGLQHLNDALLNAYRQFNTQKNLRKDLYNPLSSDFERERKELVGDFEATLCECKQLLVDNERRVHANGALQVPLNLRYNLQTNPRVENLRRRLQFHITKIAIVIERLSLQLMTDTAARVDDILGLSEQSLALGLDNQLLIQKLYANLVIAQNGQRPPQQLLIDENHFAGPLLTQRFAQHLIAQAPSKFRQALPSFKALPLVEGFDALLQLLEQSLEDASTLHTQTPEQYLKLLKARWLLGVLKDSSQYEAARPGFYYKRAIGQLEQQILRRTRTPGLVAYDEEELMSLPEKEFEIWPVLETISPRPKIVEVRPDEQEIVRLELVPSHSQSTDRLYVFQRSDDRYRIVTEKDEEGSTQFIENLFDAREDRLIPRYALPYLLEPCCEVSVVSREVEYVYRFNNVTDLHNFQYALIGYEVKMESPSISVSFSKQSLNCRGLVQIWQDPVTMSSPTSSDRSPLSSFADKNALEEVFHPQTSPSVRSESAYSFGASTMTVLEDGMEAESLPLPALAVFGSLRDENNQKRLAVLFIQLHLGIHIKHYPRDPNRHRVLYIERNDGGPFFAQVLYSKTDRNGEVDPNTWSILPFRRTGAGLAQLPKKKITFIALEFRDFDLKSAFENELSDRIKLRDGYQLLRAKDEATLQFKAGRPVPNRTRNDAQAQPNSPATSPPQTWTLPTHRAMDFGIDFEDEVVHEIDGSQSSSASRPSGFTGTSPTQAKRFSTGVLPYRQQSVPSGFNSRAGNIQPAELSGSLPRRTTTTSGASHRKSIISSTIKKAFK